MILMRRRAGASRYDTDRSSNNQKFNRVIRYTYDNVDNYSDCVCFCLLLDYLSLSTYHSIFCLLHTFLIRKYYYCKYYCKYYYFYFAEMFMKGNQLTVALCNKR